MLKLADDFTDLIPDRRRIDVHVIVNAGQLAQQGLGNFAVGGNDDFARLRINDVQRDLFTEKDVRERFGQLLVQFVLTL